MSPEPRRPDREPARGHVRDVLVLILLGSALGLSSNALLLAFRPARAVPWVRVQRPTVRLEDVLATMPAPGDSADRADRATATREPAALTPTTTHTGNTPAPPPARATAPSRAESEVNHDRSHAAAKVKPAPSSAAPVTTNGPTGTAPATTPAPAGAPHTATSADAPVIPESREPLESGLAIVRRLHEAGSAIFLDARSAEEYAEGHIAGALSLPFDEVFKEPGRLDHIEDRGRPIVTYCGGGDCDLSRNLAMSLIDSGRRRVVVFSGGLPQWKGAGLAVHMGTQP